MTRCLVVVLPDLGSGEEGSAGGAAAGGARLRKRLVSGLWPPHPRHELVLLVDLPRNASHPCFR